MDRGDELATELASKLTELLDVPAAMRFRTPLDVGDTDELVVSTQNGGTVETVLDREQNQIDYLIQVGVQQKFKGLTVAEQTVEAQALFTICDSIKDLFRAADGDPVQPTKGQLRDVQLAGCVWIGTEHEPRWIEEVWEGLNQFAAVMVLTFRGTI